MKITIQATNHTIAHNIKSEKDDNLHTIAFLIADLELIKSDLLTAYSNASVLRISDEGEHKT